MMPSNINTGNGSNPQATYLECMKNENVLKAFENVRREIYAQADASFYTLLQSGKDKNAAKQQLKKVIVDVMSKEPSAIPLNRAQKDAIVNALLEDMLGYGPIQPLLDDPEVSEVMVVRKDLIYYEKNGIIYKSDITFRDEEHVRTIIQKIVSPLGRRIDESTPLVDARLPDGSRVNAVIPPVAIDGACITIRKFGKKFTAEELVKSGSIDEVSLELLKKFVQGRLNILIIGGTGSGKTTLLNVLSSFIPPTERIVTIEDSAELQLQQEHVVRLEARPPNIEGKGEITIQTLVKNALRMRPDRIIVGECRGGEALDMLQAMNTGHEGSITTLHANSPRDAISRLTVMVLMSGQELPHKAIKEQIAAAVDLIVQVARMRDGKRRVIKMSEVVGLNTEGDVEVVDIMDFKIHGTDENGKIIGRLEPTGYIPSFLEKLAWYGIEVPVEVFQKKYKK
ncbi:putative conjugal transfer protein [Fervidicola ferrireducens]|uniref:Putative conjugal transfer protein n=1 Tax=Fervidicola ferrireducens TaxID=520764 RepID=A0A140L332_9FIRM|nr:CpaF family protein [Fervidicola ferrireducens]KXG74957.1 putative conjugal transfer protein [Fervidicola ferrireducens]